VRLVKDDNVETNLDMIAVLQRRFSDKLEAIKNRAFGTLILHRARASLAFNHGVQFADNWR
jgi:hypothetical protein